MIVAVATGLAVASLTLSLTLTRLIAYRLRYPRLMGVDVHKSGRPLVPRVGGLALTASYTASMLIYWILDRGPAALTLLSSPLIAAAVGLVEDLRELNPFVKPILLMLPAIPVIALSTYNPYPAIPFVGGARLTIIYPVLIFAAYTVVANAVNSVDVLNGSLVLSSLPPLILLATISLLEGSVPSGLSSITLAAALLGFLRYNWFPAKVFSGNIGSNLVAAVITTSTITARLEVVTLVALLPHILNEFLIIVSMGGIRSGKSFASRPVRLVRGMLAGGVGVGDPITLVRLLTLAGPLREPEVSKRLGVICSYAAGLAAVTYALGGL